MVHTDMHFYLTYAPFFLFIHGILLFGPLPFTNGALVACPLFGMGYVSTLSPLCFGDPETAGAIEPL